MMYNISAKANYRSIRKGSWTDEEDNLLRICIEKYGEGNWHRVPLRAGLNRCRKSCRLRWMNYLKPNIKRGQFSEDEADLIIRLHKLLGNRWSLIAGRIPGRTANDIKNYWNTHLYKRFSVPYPPNHPSIIHNTMSTKHNHNFKSHNKQPTFAITTSRKNTVQTQVIRPQPWTLSVIVSSVMKKPNQIALSLPDTPVDAEEEGEDEEDGNDVHGAKWWENLADMYEKEEYKESRNHKQLNGLRDGVGLMESDCSKGLNMWATASSEVPVIEHIAEHLWEDDDNLWNFDMNPWE